MNEDKNLEQNLDKSNEKLHISDVINCCPKCGYHYIYDIGYDNWECGNDDCNHTFRKKSKTGIENNS
jgi:ribosomal protein L37AE/L43A